MSSWLGGVDHTYHSGARLLHDSAGNTVYIPGVTQRENGTDAFFHHDWIGSTRYVSDAAGHHVPIGYRYDAYGNLSVHAGPDVTSVKYPELTAVGATWRCVSSSSSTR